MSIRVMSAVWDYFPRGGSEMLVALALADWCNDAGASLHPSIRSVAEKCRLSEVQARRIVHQLIETGFLEVIGNESGGAPGSSRQYRIRVECLTAITRATPIADESPTPITGDTPTALTHERDGSHPGTQTALTGESQTTIEPSVNNHMSGKPDDAVEILDYLNAKTGRRYQPVQANVKFLRGRLREGATVEQCKAVIDAKVAEWAHDQKMAVYLRPSTLFNAEKFAQYAGALPQTSSHALDGFPGELL